MREKPKPTRDTCAVPFSLAVCVLSHVSLLASLVARPVAAQSFNYTTAFPHDTFVERITSRVSSKTGSATHDRDISRITRYVTSRVGDTLIVRADSMALRENLVRVIDTDGFVGGQWKLRLTSAGTAWVATYPFVPAELAEVSDPAPAMNDFFPPTPPAIAANSRGADLAHRAWERRADSAGAQRYHWRAAVGADGAYSARDSNVAVMSQGSVDEGDVAWDVVRGPLRWHRQISTSVTSRVRGRVVEATVKQEIVVVRAVSGGR